jgi:hypothetical protein
MRALLTLAEAAVATVPLVALMLLVRRVQGALGVKEHRSAETVHVSKAG